jgi:hypothetical protein
MQPAAHRQPHGELDACARLCAECAMVCKRTFFTHCVQVGGDHVRPEHVLLVTDCIAACQIAADFLTRGSPRHADACRLCADVCQRCAEECRSMGGMEDCATTCQHCADSCNRMAQVG